MKLALAEYMVGLRFFSSSHWRSCRQRLRTGLSAGLLATLAMTALLVATPALGSAHSLLAASSLELPQELARALTTLRASPPMLLGGFFLHLGYGAVAGALFVFVTRTPSLGAGLLYGLGLWLVAVTLYAPLLGLGFAVQHQPLLAISALLPHLVYGMALAALGPPGEIVHPLREQQS